MQGARNILGMAYLSMFLAAGKDMEEHPQHTPIRLRVPRNTIQKQNYAYWESIHASVQNNSSLWSIRVEQHAKDRVLQRWNLPKSVQNIAGILQAVREVVKYGECIAMVYYPNIHRLRYTIMDPRTSRAIYMTVDGLYLVAWTAIVVQPFTLEEYTLAQRNNLPPLFVHHWRNLVTWFVEDHDH